MRNPNGYGGVSKLHGKRRKPFMVRITVGWEIVDKETGETLGSFERAADIPEDLLAKAKPKQIYEPIGYYKTQPEANIALAEYNKNPYSLDSLTVTFSELYEAWFKWKFNPRKRKQLSKQSRDSYKASYKTTIKLHDMRWLDIKLVHMQQVINECPNGSASLNNIKNLFSQMTEFALMNDIGHKNYAQFLDTDIAEEKEEIHKPFDSSEIDLLWSNVNEVGVDTALILIFSGLRPAELLLMETAKIDLENRIMQGGIKTEAGKDRIIPINKKILPLITKRLEEGNEYLICFNGKKMSYGAYREKMWDPMMSKLNLDHLPHDGRHTFGTMMDNAGANKVVLKKILGHSTKKDVTNTYTHKDIEQLKKAVDLI